MDQPTDHLTPTPETEFFWDIAEPFLTQHGTSIGTLMKFPCLRADGNFFATCDHRTGDLIVKLPRHRVRELVETGDAHPFAPAGRTFKEWATVSRRDEGTWQALIAEARAYATEPSVPSVQR
jgi:hypothetical protein